MATGAGLAQSTLS